VNNKLRRIRHFCALRQIDVSSATGISVARLSAAENGRTKLSQSEQRAVEEFLKARLRVVTDSEGADD
jgi:transcriptional regulator with XRE-family HTH domain